RGDETSVEGASFFHFVQQFFTFRQQTLHGLAFLALGPLTQSFKNPFQALDVVLGFGKVCIESSPEFLGCSCLGQLGQRLRQLILGIQNVPQFIKEQLVQIVVHFV